MMFEFRVYPLGLRQVLVNNQEINGTQAGTALAMQMLYKLIIKR